MVDQDLQRELKWHQIPARYNPNSGAAQASVFAIRPPIITAGTRAL